MEENLALFNQINSLAYWLMKESNYKSQVTFDANDDSYFIAIKHGVESIYKHHIENFGTKDARLLKFELSSIASHLLEIKGTVHEQQRQIA